MQKKTPTINITQAMGKHVIRPIHLKGLASSFPNGRAWIDLALAFPAVLSLGAAKVHLILHWKIVRYFGLSSGKRLHNELERSTMFYG